MDLGLVVRDGEIDFDVLIETEFTPSRTDSSVWMRPAQDASCYEYT